MLNIPASTLKGWGYGYANFFVRYEKKWEKAIPLLGTMTDAKIAKKVGITKSCIWHKRQALGIPKCTYEPRRKSKRVIAERAVLAEQIAEKQVAQELMNAWRAP